MSKCWYEMTRIKSRLLMPIFCLTSSTKMPNAPLDCFGKHYTCLTSTNSWKGTAFCLCKYQKHIYMETIGTYSAYDEADEASCKWTCLHSYRSLAAVELNTMWINLSHFQAAWQLLALTLVYLWLAWGCTRYMTVCSTGIYPYSVFKQGSSCYLEMSAGYLLEKLSWGLHAVQFTLPC